MPSILGSIIAVIISICSKILSMFSFNRLDAFSPLAMIHLSPLRATFFRFSPFGVLKTFPSRVILWSFSLLRALITSSQGIVWKLYLSEVLCDASAFPGGV